MKYDKVKKGTFLERPNRFVAKVIIDGEEIFCHVKNTGRCRELLVPGAEIYLEESDNPSRKYKYSLIAVRKGERLVNMDSQAPNKAVARWLKEGGLFEKPELIKSECSFASSRFDFYCEHQGKKAFIEVKGVTLENEDAVFFPDAPTERGTRHVRELMQCVKQGYEAYVVFVVQMKGVKYFSPAEDKDAAFARTLRQAASEGVGIIAVDCRVGEDFMEIADPVEVIL